MGRVDLSYLESAVDYVQAQKPLPDFVKWKYRIKEVIATKDPKKIRTALEELQEKSGVDLSDYFLFLDIIPWEQIQAEVEQELPEPIKMAIKARAVPGIATWLDFKWRTLSWDQAKEVAKFAAEGYIEDVPLVMPYSVNFEMSGTLTARITNYQVEIPVAGVYRRKISRKKAEEQNQPMEEIVFADEPAKGMKKPLRGVYWKGYLYEMIGDDNERYFIVIPDEVQLSYGKVRGMLVPVVDYKTLGETSKLRTINKMVLAKSWEVLENFVDPAAVEKHRQPDFETLYKKIFGEFRHPEWFERLLLAWMFSGDISGYPLHMLFIAPPHTGKSTILEAIEKHFPEDPVYGQGTLKGIVPSFGNGRVRVGEFLKRKRFFLVDEFLRIILRNPQDREMGGDMVGLLNEILEHKTRVASSGVSDTTLEINPRARMLAMTNWARNVRSIPDLAEAFDNAFLSRMLIYVMTKKHKNFVIQNKEHLKEIGWHPDMLKPWPELRTLVDWAHSFTIDGIDYRRVYEMVEKHREIIPAEAEDLFAGRYSDHFARILDGVVKTRYLCHEKENLVPDDADYALADQIFGAVLASWKGDIDIGELPPKLRIAYLPKAQADVFYWVQKAGLDGVTVKELAAVLEKNEPTIRYALRELRAQELVKKSGDRYYAYWVDKVEDDGKEEEAGTA